MESERIPPAARRADDRPMLPLQANAEDLQRRFGHWRAPKRGDAKPWHFGLAMWWQFVERREAFVLARQAGAAYRRAMDHRE